MREQYMGADQAAGSSSPYQQQKREGNVRRTLRMSPIRRPMETAVDWRGNIHSQVPKPSGVETRSRSQSPSKEAMAIGDCGCGGGEAWGIPVRRNSSGSGHSDTGASADPKGKGPAKYYN